MFKNIKNIIVAATLFVPTASAAATEYNLHRFSTVPERWNTNSFWLESDHGIILIDAQLLIEDAKLWAAMLKSTGKPIKGAIVTHAHPDHYGGLNTLRNELGYFPIITTKGTADTFEAMHKQATAFTAPIFGDRFDKVQIRPDQIIDGQGEITLAGITLKIEDVGPGESMNATLVYEPEKNILFSGDATMHHGHVFTGEGRSDDFLRQLNHIKATYQDVDFVYAGHGDPARIAHIDQQITYIQDIQAVAEKIIKAGNYRAKDGRRFSRAVLEKYATEITEKYPSLSDYGFPDIQIVSGNIAGVIVELEAKAKASNSNLNTE